MEGREGKGRRGWMCDKEKAGYDQESRGERLN